MSADYPIHALALEDAPATINYPDRADIVEGDSDSPTNEEPTYSSEESSSTVSEDYCLCLSYPINRRRVIQNLFDEEPVVRRPVFGVIGYDNQYGSIQVIARTSSSDLGERVTLVNTSYPSGEAKVTTNFFIQTLSETSQEAINTVNAFSQFYLSSSGDNPRSLQVRGVLLEGKNFPWLREWRVNYEKYLRGSRALQYNAEVYLTVGNTLYVGTMTSSSINRQASTSSAIVPFTFVMILRDIISIQDVEDLNSDSVTAHSIRIPASVAHLQTQASVDTGPSDGGVNEPTEYTEISTTNSSLDFVIASEIVQGDIGQIKIQDNDEFTWKEPGIPNWIQDFNMDRVVERARRANRAAGRKIYDIQNVRNMYMKMITDDLKSKGMLTDEVVASLGLPTSFQGRVAAEQRHAQEEFIGTINAGVNDAINGAFGGF